MNVLSSENIAYSSFDKFKYKIMGKPLPVTNTMKSPKEHDTTMNKILGGLDFYKDNTEFLKMLKLFFMGGLTGGSFGLFYNMLAYNSNFHYEEMKLQNAIYKDVFTYGHSIKLYQFY